MARRQKNKESASVSNVSTVALLQVVEVAQPESVPAPALAAPATGRQETPGTAVAPAFSEWDRVQHVLDWIAVYLWFACMILVAMLNVVDTIKMFLGR